MHPPPSPHPTDSIAHRIFTIRGRRVILDTDLALLYGLTTKRLLEGLRRNTDRFPSDFCFQLTHQEVATLRSQSATSKQGRGGRRYPPWVFTEHGALMAANVLNSRRAVQMSIYLVRAFLRLREELATDAAILQRLAEIERTLMIHDAALRDLYAKLQPLLLPPAEPKPKREIGFHTGLANPRPGCAMSGRPLTRAARARR